MNRRIDSGSLAHSAQEGSPEGSPAVDFRCFPCDLAVCCVPTRGTIEKPLPQLQLRQGLLETEASCETPGQDSGQDSTARVASMPREPKVWWNAQKGTWCTELGGKRRTLAKGRER